MAGSAAGSSQGRKPLKEQVQAKRKEQPLPELDLHDQHILYCPGLARVRAAGYVRDLLRQGKQAKNSKQRSWMWDVESLSICAQTDRDKGNENTPPVDDEMTDDGEDCEEFGGDYE